MPVSAAEAEDTDTLRRGNKVTLPPLRDIRDIHRDSTLNQKEKARRYGNFIVRIIDAFDDIDTNYVERIPYNFTAMLQATRNFEFYTVGTQDYAQRLSFAERSNIRIGPYFGWRWLFFGYTFDVAHLGQRPKKQGTNIDFSFYTSKLGVDLLYRRTGSSFYFRRIEGLGDEAKRFEGADAGDYIQASVTGLKLYWIFNNRRFSNRAIYSQSTIQRRSAGSFQLGANFTLHDVRFNYKSLPQELFLDVDNRSIFASLERVKYTNISLQVGYAYNWVPARNWCLGFSLQPAISYQLASTKTAILLDESETTDTVAHSKLYGIFRQRSSLGFDLTGRAGVIYNNGRWFAGLTGILHNYNYHRQEMRFSNTFGSLNLFVGFYFQRRKTAAEKQAAKATQALPAESVPTQKAPIPVIEF